MNSNDDTHKKLRGNKVHYYEEEDDISSDFSETSGLNGSDDEDSKKHSCGVTKRIVKNFYRKKKYRIIPDHLREKLIEAVETKGEKIKQAAKKLRINYSSAKSICQIYKREGRLSKKTFKGRSRVDTNPLLSETELLFGEGSTQKSSVSTSPTKQENLPSSTPELEKTESPSKINSSKGNLSLFESEDFKAQKSIPRQTQSNQFAGVQSNPSINFESPLTWGKLSSLAANNFEQQQQRSNHVDVQSISTNYLTTLQNYLMQSTAKSLLCIKEAASLSPYFTMIPPPQFLKGPQINLMDTQNIQGGLQGHFVNTKSMPHPLNFNMSQLQHNLSQQAVFNPSPSFSQNNLTNSLLFPDLFKLIQRSTMLQEKSYPSQSL